MRRVPRASPFPSLKIPSSICFSLEYVLHEFLETRSNVCAVALPQKGSRVTDSNVLRVLNRNASTKLPKPTLHTLRRFKIHIELTSKID